MISRRSAIKLAELYQQHFTKSTVTGRTSHRSGVTNHRADEDAIYDYLFTNSYDPWFCNAARELISYMDPRSIKEFVMKLHTGESLVKGTTKWSWVQREELGQELLRDFAEDIFQEADVVRSKRSGNARFYSNMERLPERCGEVQSSLELDGYIYKGGRLLVPESDVLDAKDQYGVLESLYKEVTLKKGETAFHHLNLSEEHYLAKKWDDSIGNSRKFLECTLAESALRLNALGGTPISDDGATRPAEVRNHLEREGLLSTKEKETLAKVYGLLSETGGHPYIAENDQARLMRHLALIFAQFVMLRLRGKLQEAAAT